MRTLVIAGEYPWPEDRGPSAPAGHGAPRPVPVRVGRPVLGRLQVPLRPRPARPDPRVSTGWPGSASTTVRPTEPAWRPAWPVPDLPLGLPWQDGPTVRAGAGPPHPGQTTWSGASGLRPWVLAGEPVLGPTVARSRRPRGPEDPRPAGRAPPSGGVSGRTGLRRAGSAAMADEEVRRWQRLHRRAGRKASAVVVCSETRCRPGPGQWGGGGGGHPQRLPLGGPPARPGRTSAPRPRCCSRACSAIRPTSRPPGGWPGRWADAAGRSGARRGRPTGRRARPRAVGPDDPPRLSRGGSGPRHDAELARADLVAVPVRYGSGTRVKILEAFAHRVPVVSTSGGSRGDRRWRRRASPARRRPRRLAGACARLLRSPAPAWITGPTPLA